MVPIWLRPAPASDERYPPPQRLVRRCMICLFLFLFLFSSLCHIFAHCDDEASHFCTMWRWSVTLWRRSVRHFFGFSSHEVYPFGQLHYTTVLEKVKSFPLIILIFLTICAFYCTSYSSLPIPKEALIKSARADSKRFWLSRKFQKRRNTGCISLFWNCTGEAKDLLLSRRRFIQSFPNYL